MLKKNQNKIYLIFNIFTLSIYSSYSTLLLSANAFIFFTISAMRQRAASIFFTALSSLIGEHSKQPNAIESGLLIWWLYVAIIAFNA